jgi:hypothetical protein
MFTVEGRTLKVELSEKKEEGRTRSRAGRSFSRSLRSLLQDDRGGVELTWCRAFSTQKIVSLPIATVMYSLREK